MLIKNRKGKKKGKTGITISIYEQYKKPRMQKSLTVHDMTVNQVYQKIKFFMKAIENGKVEKIIIEGE